MDEWREALGVWLHDHGLLISPAPENVSTDYGLSAAEVEYTLSDDLLKLAFDAANLNYSKNTDSFKYGWTKSYKPYPTGCELVAVFVQPVPGGLELKLHVKEGKPADDSTAGWTEFLTYHGAYTVLWPTVSGHV